MKKTISVASGILLLLYFLLPLGTWITERMGYSFSLRNYVVYAIALAIISVMAIAIVCMDKAGEVALAGRVFSLLLLPVSLINWLYYVLLSPWKFTVLCMVVCSACALTYMLKYTKQKAAKIITSVICMIMLILLCFLSFLFFLFSDFGSTIVVETVYSPDGAYKVEVISSDQGALGGDTYVNLIDEQGEMDFYMFRISRKPKQLYSGDWDAYQNMVIYWRDNQTLVINDEQYSVN